MNPCAASYTPSFVRPAHTTARAAPAKRVYTRAQLLALQPRALAAAQRGPLVDVPPFLKVPASAAALLRLPYALDVVDIEAVSSLVAARQYRSPLLAQQQQEQQQQQQQQQEQQEEVRPQAQVPPSSSSSSTPSSSAHARCCDKQRRSDEGSSSSGSSSTDVCEAAVRAVDCAVCARGGTRPCAAMQTLMHNVVRFALSTRAGACLMQPGNVVWPLLQLALVFDAKQSSLRMRLLAERHPAVVRRVAQYLFGGDAAYYMPLPPVADHDTWRSMLALLKFDALRDNTTRIITDTSRHWRRRSTPFEQFVYFFHFRDDRPRAAVRNTITRSVKPGMVAMLCGDVVAMVLLHRLGFFIPPAYYWHVFPFLRDALGGDSLTYDVVRHLARYLSARQDDTLYNPLGEPFVSRAMAKANDGGDKHRSSSRSSSGTVVTVAPQACANNVTSHS